LGLVECDDLTEIQLTVTNAYR